MTQKRPNHLIKENSPYLLQHAYNPVDWHPWGFLSLEKAMKENRLLVISIGYAACHWCHVMELESFEDPEVAEDMNSRFIAVKVDREERPDIDQVYMTAAYATTGRGGWPLNVIALPDQRPVFAGTYYSRKDWLYILKYYADLHQENPEELQHQASQIAAGMKRHFMLPGLTDRNTVSQELPAKIFSTMRNDFDPVHGGTYGAPKFPIPVSLNFLLYYGKLASDKAALDHVSLTLDKISMGGIYDHLGGGFSRYSVDAEWHVPHFEKMLYDNAQLISLYAKGFLLSKKHEWKEVVEESIGFMERELSSPEGLFYASIDADSEGREGAYYVWKTEEIENYLGPSAEVFLGYYSCTTSGNWEHGWNVLKRKDQGLPDDDLYACLQVYRHQMLTVRENRPRPATDKKILTGWNALMISGLVDASMTLNQAAWLERAKRAAEFFHSRLVERNWKLWRNSMGGSLAIAGFLDDYSLLIKSFTDLYQATFSDSWLEAAALLTSEVLTNFSSEDGLFFNLVSAQEPVVLMRSAELSDNVVPASNSVMALNLFVLGHILDKPEFIGRAERMALAMEGEVLKNPSFHTNWALLLTLIHVGPIELQVVGDLATAMRKSFSGEFLPRMIWSGGTYGLAAGLNERFMAGKTRIFVCHRKTCYPPFDTVSEALEMVRNIK